MGKPKRCGSLRAHHSLPDAHRPDIEACEPVGRREPREPRQRRHHRTPAAFNITAVSCKGKPMIPVYEPLMRAMCAAALPCTA